MVGAASIRTAVEYGVGLVLVLVCSSGCARRVDVVDPAMEQTLEDGESAVATAVVDRLERGDIVGFRFPHDQSKSFVMRIIALPGERIKMIDGQVAIGGRWLDEAYVVEANRSSDTWGLQTVRNGECRSSRRGGIAYRLKRQSRRA